ncbi:MAG: TIGR02453 family protein [Candidatus Marinimicrobia bacterium]|nr:TIGR02453 family protein [Candidatus Neomarinimicrobiota bacterium]
MNDIVFKGFKPTALGFLQELSVNNNRNWFNKNKQRYEENVMTPAFDYISAMSKPLYNITLHFTAIPKRIGGSLMRIYRDTRFAKDKTPYKTNIGIQFRHQLAKDVHSPGYYLHIAPDEIFIGIGTWRPPSDALLKIREYIVNHPEKWISTRDNTLFRKEFELYGEKLKSTPRSFPKDHELIDDLRWKDFIAVRNLEISDIQNENFVGLSNQLFKSATPSMKFLCNALDVPF